MARKKILLVDDSPTTLMMEKFILRNEPYALITASSGNEAVAIAMAECPDLVLLDGDMPDTDGEEICHRMRRMCDIPIILLTAAGHATDVRCCTTVLEKPIHALELLAKVRALLADRA